VKPYYTNNNNSRSRFTGFPMYRSKQTRHGVVWTSTGYFDTLESFPTKTVSSRDPIRWSPEASFVTPISQDAMKEAPDHTKKSCNGVQDGYTDTVELLLTY